MSEDEEDFFTKEVDPRSLGVPDWVDVAGTMERISAEASALDAARAAPPPKEPLRPPEHEKSLEELSCAHKLVALLMSCGASVLDIALELRSDAASVDRFSANRLIEEQIRTYRERFWSDSPLSKLKEFHPLAQENIEEALGPESRLKPSEKVELSKWVEEKLTGKATQQVEMKSEISLAHLLRRFEEQDAVLRAPAALAAGQNSSGLRDVTPASALPERDKYEIWLDEQEAQQK